MDEEGTADEEIVPSDPVRTDEEIVHSILQCRTHFEVLQVSSTSSPEEIKQQFKKLALTVHPDKNKSGKATEAFRAVRAAYECLSDVIKRSDYLRTYNTQVVSAQPVYRPRDATFYGDPSPNYKAYKRKQEEEERAKRQEEAKVFQEEEAEFRRQFAEKFCEEHADHFDNQQQKWKNFQKGGTKPKKRKV